MDARVREVPHNLSVNASMSCARGGPAEAHSAASSVDVLAAGRSTACSWLAAVCRTLCPSSSDAVRNRVDQNQRPNVVTASKSRRRCQWTDGLAQSPAAFSSPATGTSEPCRTQSADRVSFR